MTIETEKYLKFNEGRYLWRQYVNLNGFDMKLNGFAMKPTPKGLETLAKNLDLNIPYLEQHINFFLGT